jgi:hypothetical protein
MAALARAAVGRFRLVTPPADTGSVRGDLRALADRWTVPLDREERAAASIVGAARYDEQLRAGLDEALVRPLSEAVALVAERAEARGEAIEEDRLALLYSVLEAFWWQRFTAAGDGAVLADQVDRVVDEVLCPLVEPENLPVAV